jgi:uncharacterized protein
MDRDQKGIAGLIRRHPISAFLLWFFTVGQAFAFAPLYLDVAVPDQWFIIGSTLIGLLLPTVVITRIVDGPEGLRELGRRITKTRVPLRFYAIGIVVMPLLAIAFAVVLLGAPDVPAATLVTAIGSGLLVNTLVGFALNNLWEEVAWMGFVQARLQDRHGALRAALLTGPLFALQHIALFADSGPAMAALILGAFVLLVIPFRAFNGWLYNRTGGSLFLVGLVHALSNAVGPGAGFAPGYLRQLYPDNSELVGVLHAVALAVMGLVVIAATRGRLGLPGERARSAEAEPGLATSSVR